jgi:hypothetical protein
VAHCLPEGSFIFGIIYRGLPQGPLTHKGLFILGDYLPYTKVLALPMGQSASSDGRLAICIMP